MKIIIFAFYRSFVLNESLANGTSLMFNATSARTVVVLLLPPQLFPLPSIVLLLLIVL